MILTCPECKSRYVVNPSVLLPRGRTVRCAKCRHSWFEEKPEEDVEIVPSSPEPDTETDQATENGDQPEAKETPSEPEENEAAQPDDADDQQNENEKSDTPAEDFDFPINKPKKRQRPVPRGSNLPALQNQKYGSSKKGWIALIIFVATIIGSFLIFEGPIKDMWPATAKLYRAIGLDDTQQTPAAPVEPEPTVPVDERLKVDGLAPRMEQSGGVSQLVIAGYVENITGEPQEIPPLKVILRNANGQDIRDWNFTPTTTTVEPDARVDFETSLPNPPADARDIIVILTTPDQP